MAHLVLLVLIAAIVVLFLTAAVGSGHDTAVRVGSQTNASATGRARIDLDLVQRVSEASVVDIDATLAAGRGHVAATGLVLSESGSVLTNNHVIEGASDISARIGGAGRTYAVRVAGYDVADDLAVLQLVGARGLTPARLGDPATARAGDGIAVVGNAYGAGGPPRTQSGAIIAFGQKVTATDSTGQDAEALSGMIEVAAPVQPGDSGGPLVDRTGRVIGLTTAASVDDPSAGAARGYAIPIDRATAIAAQISRGVSSATVHVGERAVLGVSIKSVRSTPAVARIAGAVVGLVDLGSPVHAAGLRPDDVIELVDGERVASIDDLERILDPHRPGDTVQLGWDQPSGQSRTASVRLVAGPPL